MKDQFKTLPNTKYVDISDFCLAVFLSAKGIPVCHLKCEGNSNRVVFCFPDSKEVEKLKMEFINNGPIPVRSFYSTFRELKRQVYEVNK